MAKIKSQNLIGVLSFDVLKYKSCIEMNFSVDSDREYVDCWIGKMPDKDISNKEIYWYGLAADGSQAYDYRKLEDILSAKVFNEKSICDIIENVTWHSIDGCSIEERLQDYIDDNVSRVLRSAPKSIK